MFFTKKNYLKEGFEAYQEADYQKAMRCWQKASTQKIPEAMMNIAILYRDGAGVEKDREKMAEWVERSANAGSAKAANWLAYLYQMGIGVKCNSEKQWHWTRTAAERGNAEAFMKLANGYFFGSIGEVNYQKAYEYACTAKEKGLADNESFIQKCIEKIEEKKAEEIKNNEIRKRPGGEEYLQAKAISGKNKEEAIRLFTESFEKGYPDAGAELFRIYSFPSLSFHKNKYYDPPKALKYGEAAYGAGKSDLLPRLVRLCLNSREYEKCLRYAKKADGLQWITEKRETLLQESRQALENNDFAAYLEAAQEGIALGTDSFYFGKIRSVPLLWKILHIDGTIYAIAAQCVYKHSFHSAFSPITYEESDVKHWLQHDFMDCFTAEEKAVLEEISLLDAREWDPELPLECTMLFADDGDVRHSDDKVGWWLKNDREDICMQVVEQNKSLRSYPVYYPSVGVRPVIRLKREFWLS